MSDDYYSYQQARQSGNKVLRNIFIALLVIVSVMLWSWYHNTHYSTAFNNNFKTSCEAQGASQASCACALGRLQENYTFKQAKSMEETGQYPQTLLDDVQNNCQ